MIMREATARRRFIRPHTSYHAHRSNALKDLMHESDPRSPAIRRGHMVANLEAEE
jgi:hypothetical protein